MIGYITVGTNNLSKACDFYDTVLAEMGTKRLMDFETFVAWGIEMDQPLFSVTKPFDKEAATVGNGVMIALAATDRAMVDKVYNAAIAAGGTCEGKPGLREEAGDFYAGYFRDLDGNKINAFFMGSGE